MALPFLNSLPLSVAASNPISQARKRLVTVGTFLGMYPGEWHPVAIVFPNCSSRYAPGATYSRIRVDHGINGGHKGTSFLSGVYKPGTSANRSWFATILSTN